LVLIDALFINKGGGAVLLDYLIEQLLANGKRDDFFFLLDPRYKIPALLEKNYTVISNSVKVGSAFIKRIKVSLPKCFVLPTPPHP
jgi:hypothetical protein